MNRTTFLALVISGCRVCGLIRWRALRSRTWKVPKPLSMTLSPFYSPRLMLARKRSKILSVAAFDWPADGTTLAMMSLLFHTAYDLDADRIQPTPRMAGFNRAQGTLSDVKTFFEAHPLRSRSPYCAAHHKYSEGKDLPVHCNRPAATRACCASLWSAPHELIQYK